MANPTSHERAIATRRLKEVKTPVTQLDGLDLSGELLRGEAAHAKLTANSWRSNHAFTAATALEHVIKILQEPKGQYAGVYRFNARQNLDSLAKRLEDPELNCKSLDITHRADLLEFLQELRRTVNALSEGGEPETAKQAFAKATEAALRIGGE